MAALPQPDISDCDGSVHQSVSSFGLTTAMRGVARFRRERLSSQSWAWGIVLLLAVGVWVDAHGLSIPDLDRILGTLPQGRAVAVSPYDVVDGDTVRVAGETYRLVGFNAPETGRRAQCARERDLADRATTRLRNLIGAVGNAELRPVQCSCTPGTHGTRECNYGRSCAILSIDGRDVGSVLISEGLARRYACGPTTCPRRPSWC